MSKTVFNLESAPTPAGPYSHAVFIERPLFFSGIVAFVQNEESGIWEEPQGLTLAEETHQAIKNLESALGDLSLTLENVGSMTVYVNDITDEKFVEVNEAYAEGFSNVREYSARACVGGKPPLGFQIELMPVIALPRDYVIPTQ